MARKSLSSSVRRIRELPTLPARPIDGHKGTFGRVLVIGGSVGMAGAPAMVGLAALRSGAGLVTVAVPAPIQPTVAGLCPCATTLALPAGGSEQIEPAKALAFLKKRGLTGPAVPDALVVGPGLGTGSAAYSAGVWRLINAFRKADVPVVLDADALNLSRFTRQALPNSWNTQPHLRTILTPHPGELARMHGMDISQVQADREEIALQTARIMAAQAPASEDRPVVVLKGAGTIVTDGTRLYVNTTGNPGMATGGSGDVLSGILGGLVGQGMDTFEAAALGVFVHGRAGDLAADQHGQISLIATDLIESLPAAFKEQVEPQSRKR